MADEKKTPLTTDPILEAEQESTFQEENKEKRNQKVIAWGVIATAAIVIVVLVYVFAIRRPGIMAGNNAIGQADTSLAMGQDSIALAQYQQVADKYGYDAGNRAALNAAIILYQQASTMTDKAARDAKLNEALKYCAKYDAKEAVIGAAARSLEGDCYVNLGQLEQALGCYEKAISTSAKNPYYTPTFMMKQATVQRALKNYAAEAAIYEQIESEYPSYGQMYNIDVKKYLDRAKANAAQK
ncbi:MAG: hypothetical protein J6C91_02525 [Muribaculaceae bacterium]|nr:hypothetical protein [Muribaculaceae bacterium]